MGCRKKRGREKESKYLLGNDWKENEIFREAPLVLDGKWLGTKGQ